MKRTAPCFSLTSKSRRCLALSTVALMAWLCNPDHATAASPSGRELPPRPRFDPRDYGAKGDGGTYDTVAIQKAIDACSGTGGSVVLKPGKYVSAELTLRGGMTFRLEKGAVLLGGTTAADYPVLMPAVTPTKANTRSLLYACNADNLVIEGPGEIDGRCKQVQMWGKEKDRPSLIRIFQSTNVTVRDITLRNPRMWTQVYSECSGLLIDHVTVDAPPDCPNLDGMDLCDSQNVTVRNCVVRSEDDCICLKTHGTRGLANITVENNRLTSHRANAIKIGTATVGPISGLVFRDNVIDSAKFGGICIESVDGAAVRDVRVKGLEMRNVSQPLFIRLARRNGNNGASDLQPGNRPVGSIDGVLIEGLHAVSNEVQTRPSCSITGIPGARVRNVTLRDCSFVMPGGMTKVPDLPPEREGDYPQSDIVQNPPAYGLFIRHADDIRLENVTFGFFKPDVRPWLFSEDASVTTNGCHSLGLLPQAGH
jgi:polygalacturonase